MLKWFASTSLFQPDMIEAYTKLSLQICYLLLYCICLILFFKIIWAPSSEFVSKSIPSWQILTVHAQQFRGARDLAFCLKVPLDSLPVWAISGGSGETARIRRLAWTFAARIGDKYQIRLMRSISIFIYRTYFSYNSRGFNAKITHIYQQSCQLLVWSILLDVTDWFVCQ